MTQPPTPPTMQLFLFRTLTALWLLRAASCTSAVGRGGVADSTVSVVISFLEEMLKRGQEEKQAEEVQYAAYKQFCETTSAQKEKDIQEAAVDIEALQAGIQKATVKGDALNLAVQKHQQDVQTWTGDQKAATRVRDMEAEDYAALHQDYSESIDALGRAIDTLKAEDYSRPQAEALVQLDALRNLRLIPDGAKRTLDMFLAQGVQAPETPEAHGYEFQSGKIIDVLEGLLVKFRDELTEIEKHELDTKSAYDKLMQDLTASIDSANQDVATKSQAHSAQNALKAEQEGSLAQTENAKADDEAYRSDLVATCESKASDYDSRSQLRSAELKTIQEAIAILSSDKVLGTAQKHMEPVLLAGNHTQRPVLAFLRASGTHDGDNERNVAEFLLRRAQKLNSEALAHFAAQLKREDPLARVKTMIHDLIARLKEEENEDASHEEWCTTELTANEATRTEKTQQLDRLAAHIDDLEAKIAILGGEISDLSKQSTELTAAVAEENAARAKEKATNMDTIKDAQEGQEAVSRAVLLLEEFYAGAADATALLQKQQPVAPEIFESPYKGMQDEGNGIISLLKMLAGDFAKLEADTTAAEETAVQEHKKFLSDSEIEKTAKSKDIDYKTAQKQKEAKALVVAKGDHESTRKELNMANDYYEKLKPSCVDEERYDEYIAQKQAEIESLEEALAILEGNTTSLN